MVRAAACAIVASSRSRPIEHVAGAVRHAGMEQRDVRLDRRQQHDRIVIAERIVDHAPVRPVLEDVGADQPAQRHERHALLGRLHGGVERRAGRVLHADGPAEDRGGEARRRAELAEADRATSPASRRSRRRSAGRPAGSRSAARPDAAASRRAGSARASPPSARRRIRAARPASRRRGSAAIASSTLVAMVGIAILRRSLTLPDRSPAGNLPVTRRGLPAS